MIIQLLNWQKKSTSNNFDNFIKNSNHSLLPASQLGVFAAFRCFTSLSFGLLVRQIKNTSEHIAASSEELWVRRVVNLLNQIINNHQNRNTSTV